MALFTSRTEGSIRPPARDGRFPSVSSRSRDPYATARGFTLLEVLVVVLIVGVVLSIATLGFTRDPGDRLETEARRFTALVTLAAQESVLQAREHAVVFDDRGYGFLVFEGGQWAKAEDRVFRRRELPEGLYLDIAIEGQGLALLQAKEGQKAPRIFLLSSGEMTPFELTLRHEESDESYRLRGDIGGKIDLDV